MDAGTLGAIATVLVTVAFFGVCCWAFSPRLKQRFEEDARLPFADDESSSANRSAADKLDNEKKDHPL